MNLQHIVSYGVIFMKYKKRATIPLLLLLFFFILDAKTVCAGAEDGIELCIKSLIPSLFPFFIITTMLNSRLNGRSISFLAPICKVCGIPRGMESIFVLGILGGYPVGAQCIQQSFHSGLLSKQDAARMLGFCNNAGPAFLFGLISGMFSTPYITWTIWLIQIISALLVGISLPMKSHVTTSPASETVISMQQAVKQSIINIITICGWVIWFRVILQEIFRWILWMLPIAGRTVLAGFLELSNGCFMLQQITNPGLRFIICSSMAGFGGLCIAMQVSAVTKDLGLGLYFPGKILQTVLCFILSGFAQYFIFDEVDLFPITPVIFLITLTACMVLIFTIRKITVDFSKTMMYNSSKCERKRAKVCCFEKSSQNPAAIANMLPN